MESTRADCPDTKELLSVLTAVLDGDFTRLLPDGHSGIQGEIAATINARVRQLNVLSSEVARINREIGTEGRFGGQAEVEGISGAWRDLVDGVNHMGANLTNQVRNLARVARGVVEGNPSRRVTVEAHGETLELKESLNAIVDRASVR